MKSTDVTKRMNRMINPGKFGNFLLSACLFLCALPLTAATVEAKKNGIKVYSEASKKSAVISTLKKGESLEAGDRQGMYWAVKLPDGKAGFVSVMRVKRKNIKKEGLSNAIRNAVQEARDKSPSSETRSRSTVMGIRGLDDTSDTAYAGSVKPNLRLVYQMEDFYVQETDVEDLEGLVFQEIEKRSARP